MPLYRSLRSECLPASIRRGKTLNPARNENIGRVEITTENLLGRDHGGHFIRIFLGNPRAWILKVTGSVSVEQQTMLGLCLGAKLCEEV